MEKSLFKMFLFIGIFTTFSKNYSDDVKLENRTDKNIKAWSVYPGGTGLTCPSKGPVTIGPWQINDGGLSTSMCALDEIKIHVLDDKTNFGNKLFKVTGIKKMRPASGRNSWNFKVLLENKKYSICKWTDNGENCEEVKTEAFS